MTRQIMTANPPHWLEGLPPEEVEATLLSGRMADFLMHLDGIAKRRGLLTTVAEGNGQVFDELPDLVLKTTPDRVISLARDMAQYLVARRGRVALLDLNDTQLANAKNELGERTLIARVDVTDQEAVRAAIAPAVIFTEMVAKMTEQQVKYMTVKIPMARCGTKEEVADLCGFILSPGASFTTGFTYDLSGGRATY